MTRRLGVLIAVALAARGLSAQEALLPSTGWGVGGSISAWHFSTALPQSAGAVADVAEAALPFRMRGAVGRWSFDLSGTGAIGAVHLTSGSDGNSSDKVVSIAGPTDVKLRITGPLLSDALQLTAGVNIPSGRTGLNADETTALQAVGAPALHMPVAAFGTGPGMTLGFVKAFDRNDWAFALGASVEQRSEYSPIALALTSGRSETKVTPGTAVHVTAGVDRPLGSEGRWSLLFVGDLFSKDKIALSGSPNDGSNDYTLGPQFTVSSSMDLAASGWRQASFNVAARMRSAFSDASGQTVSGSNGSYLEGSLGGVRGGATGSGLVIGIDGRWHSGLTFTDALVGAATTAGGLTIGYERAGERTATRFTVRGQFGTFDTGKASTSAMGLTIGLSVSARREAR